MVLFTFIPGAAAELLSAAAPSGEDRDFGKAMLIPSTPLYYSN